MSTKRRERRVHGAATIRRSWAAPLTLALLCAALYGRTVAFGYTRTDDTVQLLDNASFVASLRNLPEAFARPFFAANGAASYYRPVVTLSYMLDAQWSGVDPSGYRLTNVLLHFVAAALFFAVSIRLGFQRDHACVAAAILAVHPALTEAVAWIPGRGDTLLAIWFLSALLCLMRWLKDGRPLWLVMHGWFVLVALFTKEAAIALPAVFIAFVLLVARRPSVLRGPRLWVVWGGAVGIWFVSWRAVIGGSEANSPVKHLAEMAGHLTVPLMFLGKAMWPTHPAVLAIEQDTSWLPGAVAALLLAVVFWWLRDGDRRLFAWGVSSFLLLLAPSLAVSDFLILEIRSYAPLVGLLVAVLAVARQLCARWPSAKTTIVVRAVGVVAVTALAIRSTTYAASFRDVEAFTAQAVATSPHSTLAHCNRGIALQLAKRLDEAEAEYQHALALDRTIAVAHNNLGLIELNRARFDSAEGLFREELALNPSYDKAYVNLALALKASGRIDEAVASLQQAVELNPSNADALEGLASYYAFRGDSAAAEQYRGRLRSVRAESGQAGLRTPE